MEGAEAAPAAVQVELLEGVSGNWDLVGFGGHDGAAQVVLAGHGDGDQQRVAAALAVGDRVDELFAHCSDIAQVVILSQQALGALFGLGA